MSDHISNDEWRGYVRARLEETLREIRDIKVHVSEIEERQRRTDIASAKTAGVVAVIVSLLMVSVEWAFGRIGGR